MAQPPPGGELESDTLDRWPSGLQDGVGLAGDLDQARRARNAGQCRPGHPVIGICGQHRAFYQLRQRQIAVAAGKKRSRPSAEARQG
jgi:hypothetical protein